MNFRHILFKKDIKKYIVIVLSIVFVLGISAYTYWTPNKEENIDGICTTRYIGHGGFVVQETVSSSADIVYELIPIKSSDYQTLKTVGSGYCKDKNHVYYAGKIVQDVNPNTFTIPINPK